MRGMVKFHMWNTEGKNQAQKLDMKYDLPLTKVDRGVLKPLNHFHLRSVSQRI